ncbi:3'-tRNA processing endonuclease Trz1 [Schizosaccharomyces japonicus yFS275]|uniref:ribonuclease Z n=1 Tax=Schizosaccharomyces japonicus (strain yFS275 / FY16936) TaxID=402676 RepID=B6K809_SCHJY|nr:3'-tRNA processing endonuclease Trz1 [Schizosaccharomyces japonicus yFS275]EEB09663.1 3'-tRNA processing endonuclease Trz1 [Schizosaccharomyces japonicus yFS275]
MFSVSRRQLLHSFKCLRLALRNYSQQQASLRNNDIHFSFITAAGVETSAFPLIHLALPSERFLIGDFGEQTLRCVMLEKVRCSTKLKSAVVFPPVLNEHEFYQKWSSIAGLPGYSLTFPLSQPWGLHADAFTCKAFLRALSFSRTQSRAPDSHITPYENDSSMVIYEDPFISIKQKRHNSWCSLHVSTPVATGVFDVEKAIQLGVKPGPAFGLLTKGQSVLSSDGFTRVHPEQVLGSPKPPKNLVLLGTRDISETAFDDALNCLKLNFIPSKNDCVVHILPRGLWSSEYVNNVMKKHKNITNIISAPELLYDRSLFQRSRRFTSSLVCEQFYPWRSTKVRHARSILPKDTYIAQQGLSVALRTDGCSVSGHKESFDESETRNSMKSREIITSHSTITLDTLGTGSSCASIVRNVSGYFLSSGKDTFLLDCGEGSLSQLSRQYGSNTDVVLSRLKCIFISHSHADHHYGLPSIIQALLSFHLPYKVLLICPLDIKNWCNFLFPSIHQAIQFATPSTIPKTLETEPSWTWTTVQALHTKNSYSIVLSHRSLGKIVYSGDTRPNSSLIKVGRDAKLLIHEATLDDSLSQLAVEKRHCTFSEALLVAKKMKSQNTVLTHFSQRYKSDYVIRKLFPKLPKNVVLACDNLHLVF